MNLLPKGVPSMRIIALPLTRVKISQGAIPKPHSDLGANTTLVFYHIDLNAPDSDREDVLWHKRLSKNLTSKAADIWTSLGNAPKDSWKLWTYELGERIADRIEFEELSLRSVDPSLGPLLNRTRTQVSDGSKNTSQLPSLPKIPLIYPPTLYQSGGADHALHSPITDLKTLLASHELQHRRGFYLWMFIAPLTTPITLIPIIPNLPLFFCVWRSWSHYRAYRTSQYVSSLLDLGLIEPTPSLELDKIYASSASPSGLSQNHPSPTSGSPEKQYTLGNVAADRKSKTTSGKEASRSVSILLTHKMVPHILKMFGLPESAATNMHRAIDQARGRLDESS